MAESDELIALRSEVESLRMAIFQLQSERGGAGGGMGGGFFPIGDFRKGEDKPRPFDVKYFADDDKYYVYIPSTMSLLIIDEVIVDIQGAISWRPDDYWAEVDGLMPGKGLFLCIEKTWGDPVHGSYTAIITSSPPETQYEGTFIIEIANIEQRSFQGKSVIKINQYVNSAIILNSVVKFDNISINNSQYDNKYSIEGWSDKSTEAILGDILTQEEDSTGEDPSTQYQILARNGMGGPTVYLDIGKIAAGGGNIDVDYDAVIGISMDYVSSSDDEDYAEHPYAIRLRRGRLVINNGKLTVEEDANLKQFIDTTPYRDASEGATA